MLWSLGFLGNHELSILSKVSVVGIFANRKVSATLRTPLGQKYPKSVNLFLSSVTVRISRGRFRKRIYHQMNRRKWDAPNDAVQCHHG